MRILRSCILAAAGAGLLAQTPPITPQATRGKALFFESAKGMPCGTCHQLEGKGADVGPDLKTIGALSPKGILMAVMASRTAYVQEVKTAAGTFPGMLKGQAGETSTFYDLSANPPRKRELKKAVILDLKDNASWKHPVEAMGFTPEELADIIAYVRWAGKGHVTAVNPADMKQ